ncbi:N-acetyl-gamma-glutamyl-phosphate reductase [Polluticoccus soli]|uniref:N-acetyl-gamma-glutamyl-phosphate reductase n=1 Tax=Polluticoccus soli TaxID=3034150 RepID=UPI0023E3028B|nr:N-acetyl-gamma-glutamyl-phosphate reductase [Flavipsychrobacter sp. JY13-12]
MSNKIKAGIIGGAGYTGGETLRLLLNHPHVEIAFINSRSQSGQPVHSIHTDLLGETELEFTSDITDDVDVVFLCVGHGEAKEQLQQTKFATKVKIIDLSQDHRLAANATIDQRQFIYGLPEINRDYIREANAIANPGCFATAIQLATLPLAANGLLNDVHATGITGSSGAGQKLQQSSHFTWRANNIEAYKTLSHQHLGEITETLTTLQPSLASINFVPWRGDFTRGIYISAYTKTDKSLAELANLYKDYYVEHPFVTVSDKMINLKQVVGTNKCLLHLEKVGDNVVIHAAIDNLLKGASGQAVQNMNLMFGLDETMGLKLKATSF